MSIWFVLGILMLALCSEANVSFNDIDNEIHQGLEKVAEIAKLSKEEVEKIMRIINNKNISFLMNINTSLESGSQQHDANAKKINSIVKKTFDKAINMYRDTKIFVSILEAKQKSTGELMNIFGSLEPQLQRIQNNGSNKLTSLEAVLDFTNEISAEFYRDTEDKMKRCKDKGCVTQLIGSAETKQKSLFKIFAKYQSEISRITDKFDNEIATCMRDVEGKFAKALDDFEFEMLYL